MHAFHLRCLNDMVHEHLDEVLIFHAQTAVIEHIYQESALVPLSNLHQREIPPLGPVRDERPLVLRGHFPVRPGGLDQLTAGPYQSLLSLSSLSLALDQILCLQTSLKCGSS